MAGRTAGGDPWRITVEERAKHDNQFFQLSPSAGFISGEQAKKFFMQSGLPTPILGQIWALADMNADGKMDKKEFSIAMSLISKKLHGFELPPALPASLKQDPTSGAGTGGFGVGAGMPGGGMAGTMAGTMGMQRPQMQMAGMMPGTMRGFAPMATPGSLSMATSGSMTLPRMSNGGFASTGPGMGGFGMGQGVQTMPKQGFQSPQKVSSTGAGGDWSVPQSSKLKYTQMFNAQDRQKKGFLSSMEARAILTQSGLTHNILAQVWTLSDIDSDGKLTCDEFVLAMHLIDLVRTSGQPLPAKLPPDLVPPSYRKQQMRTSHAVGMPPGGLGGGIGSATSIASMPPSLATSKPSAHDAAFSDLLGSSGFGVGVPQSQAPHLAGTVSTPNIQGGVGGVAMVAMGAGGVANGSEALAAEAEAASILQATFEDKRKENFDKGQAELERRRQLLLEQQRKMEQERMEKERAEAEKREQKRLEMERKKQMELERQMEKQRQIEMAREEERRKALEQREAARRELERQRQMEWERQRRDQLMAEKQREQALVDQSQGEVAKLRLELEALDNKKRDMGNQIEEARNSVTNVTSQIDRMRTSRDLKLSEIDRLTQQVTEWRQKLLVEQQQRQQLEIRYQADNNTVDDTYKTVLHSVNNKKVNIDKLKEQLKQIEADTAENLKTIDSANTKVKDLQKQVDSLKDGNSLLNNDVSAKRTEWNSQANADTLSRAFDSNTAKSPSPAVTKAPETNRAMTKTPDIWSSAFAELSNATGTTTGGNDIWGNGTSTTNETKANDDAWGSVATGTASADVVAKDDAWGGAGAGSTTAGQTPDAWSNAFSSNTEAKTTVPIETVAMDSVGELKGDFPTSPLSRPSLRKSSSSEPELNSVFKNAEDKDLFKDSGGGSGVQWGPEGSSSGWADAFKPQQPAASTGEGCPGPGYRKFKGMFQFEARNDDELSFNPGDTVWVKPDQSEAEEGWLGGLCNGREGWFPAAYAEECGDQPTNQSASPAVNQLESAVSQTPTNEVGAGADENKFEADFNAFGNTLQPNNSSALTASADSSFTLVTQNAPPSPSPDPTSSSTPSGTTGNSEMAPAGLRAQALYTWRAKKENHLTFEKGDVILVKEQQDMWWSGELNGQSGWFPKSYVKLLSGNASALPQSSSTHTPVDPALGAEDPSLYQNTDFSQPGDSEGPHTGPEQQQFTFERAVAMYTYNSAESGDLTFAAGDVITITGKEDDWWTGQIDDRSGIFPANYVKVLDESSSSPTAQPASQSPSQPVTQAPTPPATQTPSQPEPAPQQAMAPLSSQPVVAMPPVAESDHVTSPSAESHSKTFTSPTSTLTKKKSETGTTSFQPINLSPDAVNKPDATSPEDENKPEIGSEEDSTERWSVGSSLSSLGTIREHLPADHHGNHPASPVAQPSQKSSKKEIAQVIAPYQATGPEQLSLQPGQLIQVRKKSPSGWWEGELQARGQKRKVGWFPANYVKVMGGSARSTPAENALAASPQPSEGSRSATPVSMPAPAMAPSLEQVVALYNYAAQHEDEMTFAKGSVINVLEKGDPDWWKGELNGGTGMFPANYVAPLAEAFQGQQEQPASSEVESAEQLEQKRQRLISELIGTERSYCHDLDVVLNSFYKPLKLAGVLSKEETEGIFVNLRDIRRCNLKLYNGFKVRQRTYEDGHIHMIGDILCENLPHMQHYVRFCSCQLNAAGIIQRKCETDPKFVEAHKKCVSDPATQGMTLGSYLMKPMQRITKYPLLLEKLLACTPESHHDHGNVAEALSMAKETCNQVNEGVREKENSDKLEWIQAHVICEGLSEKLTFNSVTNCLGPRKFLYSGSLYKAKSGKELVGFLFNDFLLLTVPQQSLGNVTSVFSFDMKTDTQFKIYRNPIFLNEVLVKKPQDSESGPDACLWHVQHAEHVYSLRAVTHAEREAWVRQTDAASRNYRQTEQRRREKAHQAKVSLSEGCVGRLLVLVLEGVNLIPSDSNARRASAMGRVLVVVMEATDLVPQEDGKSDPYCEVSMGAQEHKTKVIANSLNPKWNHSMQFSIRDPQEDVLCITVYDRDLFTPNDFLGRTEMRLKDVLEDTRQIKGPIIKRLKLYEVASGEVIVKLDLQLFNKA